DRVQTGDGGPRGAGELIKSTVDVQFSLALVVGHVVGRDALEQLRVDRFRGRSRGCLLCGLRIGARGEGRQGDPPSSPARRVAPGGRRGAVSVSVSAFGAGA